MIPQLESTLGDAISSNFNCVDENGNVVCQVYKATVENTGDTSAELTGSISFLYTTSSSYTVEQRLPNLKWKRITNATTLGEYNTYQALSSDQVFEENKVFAPDATQDYYFVIWIDETGELQSDTGTFRATINFNTADGDGLTSTIKTNHLSNVIVGSYVSYTGNNGCPEGHCDGTNANYVSDTDMGYCNGSGNKFIVNGWRIMAKDSGGIYIVSAGAPECMCTNSDGTYTKEGYCDSYIANSDDIYLHFDNMNEIARSYCNTEYVKGGVCDGTTAWALKDSDYTKITGSYLDTCLTGTTVACGRDNDLIDNGGNYWFATAYRTYYSVYYWDPSLRDENFDYSHIVRGVRPVLYLDPEILITGGEGTYTSPYQISNG